MIVFYDTRSGGITKLLQPSDLSLVPLYIEDTWEDYLDVTEEVDGPGHYVDSGKIVAKKALPYTQAISGLVVTLTGLPVGTRVVVVVDDEEQTPLLVDDQPTEIDFELPGTYTLMLSGSAPHLDEELEVIVNG